MVKDLNEEIRSLKQRHLEKAEELRQELEREKILIEESFRGKLQEIEDRTEEEVKERLKTQG